MQFPQLSYSLYKGKPLHTKKCSGCLPALNVSGGNKFSQYYVFTIIATNNFKVQRIVVMLYNDSSTYMLDYVFVPSSSQVHSKFIRSSIKNCCKVI